jgi:hypothetical protein
MNLKKLQFIRKENFKKKEILEVKQQSKWKLKVQAKKEKEVMEMICWPLYLEKIFQKN